MDKLNGVNHEDITKHDIIVLPVSKQNKKKLQASLLELKGKNGSWVRQALSCLPESLEHGKSIVQWDKKLKIIWLGIDESESYQKISNIIRSAVFKQMEPDDKKDSIVILSGLKSNAVSALANGAQLAYARVNYYKKDRKNEYGFPAFYNSSPSMRQIARSWDEGKELALTQEKIMRLVNMPSNIKNPKYLTDWCKSHFANRNIIVEILDNNQLKVQGFGSLIAVGKGATTPPYLLKLHYDPQTNQYLKHIGLVGKGVTFDTGGISLKDPLNMHLMKSDMGGAAAVIGAVDIIEKLKIPVKLTAVIPLAENAIGPDAYRPGDVITAYNGKTIEVLDTDAEGRLILADALAYIVKKYKPDHLIDLATLTGSCIMTLGFKAAGLYSNDETLADSMISAGHSSGERVWRLPLWDDYAEEMNSDIADIKNLATKPVAGATTAAKFLQAFIEGHKSWAHLDIAGVAMTDNEYSKQRSATAYGVLLLKEWVNLLIQKKSD